jgi:hypothetical protein
MGFERFTEVGRAFRPRASIRSNGQIGFNQGAVKRYELEQWPYAVLFYDKDTKRIGIRLTKDEKEEGIVRLVCKSGNGAISARSFLYYYDIAHDKTRALDIEQDKSDGMLILRLP